MELAFSQADGQEGPDATHQLPPRPALHSSVDGQVLLDASGSQALDLKRGMGETSGPRIKEKNPSSGSLSTGIRLGVSQRCRPEREGMGAGRGYGSPPVSLGSLGESAESYQPLWAPSPTSPGLPSPLQSRATFNFLNCWRERKPLQAAWSRPRPWDTSFSRCFSSRGRTPAFRKTCPEGRRVKPLPISHQAGEKNQGGCFQYLRVAQRNALLLQIEGPEELLQRLQREGAPAAAAEISGRSSPLAASHHEPHKRLGCPILTALPNWQRSLQLLPSANISAGIAQGEIRISSPSLPFMAQ